MGTRARSCWGAVRSSVRRAKRRECLSPWKAPVEEKEVEEGETFRSPVMLDEAGFWVASGLSIGMGNSNEWGKDRSSSSEEV